VIRKIGIVKVVKVLAKKGTVREREVKETKGGEHDARYGQ
jgi:hypothetical protein